MAVNNIAITQLAQVGMAEKIVQNAHAHPELQKQAAQEATPELLRQENSTVEKSADSKKSRQIKTGEKDPNAGKQQPKEQRKKKPHDDQDDQDASSGGSAWTGNLLNLKV